MQDTNLIRSILNQGSIQILTSEQQQMLDGEIPIGRKLFEEIDKPIESKLISENRDEGILEIEST